LNVIEPVGCAPPASVAVSVIGRPETVGGDARVAIEVCALLIVTVSFGSPHDVGPAGRGHRQGEQGRGQ